MSGKSNFSARMSLSFSDRASIAKAQASKKLFELMEEKRSNLAFAADVTNSAEFLRLVKATADEVAIVKTHIDVIDDYSPALAGELKDLSRDHSFLIFEDGKFADIGQTVKLQYGHGVYKIASWAHFVTVHSVPGTGAIEGLYEVARPLMENGEVRGGLLLAQMSSKGTLATGEYTEKTVEMARQFPAFAAGFIGAGSVPGELKKLAEMAEAHFAILTPGVKLHSKSGELLQQYAHPKDAVFAGSDCIIVGGGIFKAEHPKTAAQEYRNAAWNAYLERMK